MNSSTLSYLDDLTKYLVLDPYLGFHTKKIIISDINTNKTDWTDELQYIINLFIEKNDKKETVRFLLNFCNSNGNLLYKFNISKKVWIKKHIEMYLECLSSQSEVSIIKCSSYSSENYAGVGVIVKNRIKYNTIIKNLKAVKKYISEEEVKLLKTQKVDFSVMHNTKSKCPVLLLGTASLVNYHCKPNCMYKCISLSEVMIETMKDIEANTELFCTYGPHYFGINNLNCECSYCKKSGNFVQHFDCRSEIEENLKQNNDHCSYKTNKRPIHASPITDKSIKINKVNENSKLSEQKCSSVMNEPCINTCSTNNKNTNTEENNIFKSVELIKIYCNIIKFKEYLKELKINENKLNNDEQRRKHFTSGKGLKYDNSLYTKFIKFLKFEQSKIQISEKYEPTDEDLVNIVKKLYSSNHLNY